MTYIVNEVAREFVFAPNYTAVKMELINASNYVGIKLKVLTDKGVVTPIVDFPISEEGVFPILIDAMKRVMKEGEFYYHENLDWQEIS